MVNIHSNTLHSIKHNVVTKFAAVSATLLTLAIVSSAGVAAAAPAGKPTKAECQAAGFTNYGQCVKEWAHNKNHGGHGYGYNGGNETANVKVNNNVHGHHNVFSAVYNFFFGSGSGGNSGQTANVTVNNNVGGNNNVFKSVYNFFFS